MKQLKEIVYDIFFDSWEGGLNAIILSFVGLFLFILCPYAWKNILILCFMPFIMLIASNLISRNFNKLTSQISMVIINFAIILLSCILLEKQTVSEEPEFIEQVMFSTKYYMYILLIFAALAIRHASSRAVVCPKCGEWNSIDIPKRVVEASYKSEQRYRNDKKVYDNMGKHVASIENYDTCIGRTTYGHYKYKCRKCNQSWKVRFSE